jgi:hypothetical protein
VRRISPIDANALRETKIRLLERLGSAAYEKFVAKGAEMSVTDMTRATIDALRTARL